MVTCLYALYKDDKKMVRFIQLTKQARPTVIGVSIEGAFLKFARAKINFLEILSSKFFVIIHFKDKIFNTAITTMTCYHIHYFSRNVHFSLFNHMDFVYITEFMYLYWICDMSLL